MSVAVGCNGSGGTDHHEQCNPLESVAVGYRSKTKWRTAKDDSIILYYSYNNAVESIVQWIQSCTGVLKRDEQSLFEFVQDGVILCELLESLRPGLIKKINRVKSRFAYWENFSFFLHSCRSIGLQDWQLFDPEDFLSVVTSSKSNISNLQEEKIHKIIITLYWLYQLISTSRDFTGPQLDVSCFNNKDQITHQLSGSNLTSEHKSLSVSSPPPPLPTQSPPPPLSPGSPILWVQKLHIEEEERPEEEIPYKFTHSSNPDDNSQSSTNNQEPVTTTNHTLTRKETYTVLVQAHNPPPAYSADLVFVHGSTSSSILSPTSAQPPPTSNHQHHYSPNHLSNSFVESDQIDNTGLLLDTRYSQVFTCGSTSQDSDPTFSSERLENTFHINLTQTSQPDSNHSQLEYPLHNPELPAISELTNNSPIDTFDLHHSRSAGSNIAGCHSNCSQTEYSYSQEYRDLTFVAHPNTLTNHTQSPHSSPSLTDDPPAPPPPDTYSKLEEVKRTIPYLRYSSPQQKPSLHNTNRTKPLSNKEEEEKEDEMSIKQRHMRVVPSVSDTEEVNNNMLIVITLLPDDTELGMRISDDEPVIEYVNEGSAAERCGLRLGDILISINETLINDKPHNEIMELLKEGLMERKVLMNIHRRNESHSPTFGNGYLATAPSPNLSSSFHQDSSVTLRNPSPPGNHSPHQDDPRIIQEGFVTPTTMDDHISPLQAGGFRGPTLSLPNLGLDIQRVHSGALPKHMTASKVAVQSSLNRHEKRNLSLSSSSPPLAPPTSLTEEPSGNEILTDVNETAVEIRSIDSRLSSSTIDDKGVGGAKESLPSGSEEDHSKALSGKSLSVTELPTTSNNESSSKRRATVDHYSYKPVAKKTESLPPRILTSGSSSSGLGLTNVSIEDVSSVSRLHMDQIWQEVESTASITSPPAILHDEDDEDDVVIVGTPSDVGGATMDTPLPAPSDEDQSRKLKDVIGRRNSTTSSKGIDALLNTLRSLNEKIGTYDEEEEFKLLEELLQSNKFRKAKDFHDKMRDLVTQNEETETPPPTTKRILPHSRRLRNILHENCTELDHEHAELRRLLRKPHIQGILFCHDKIATQDLYVPSSYFPRSAQDTEDVILSHSALDLYNGSLFVSQEAPLSRDVPSSRKENATIVYLQRSNRPLGCTIYKQGDAVFVGKLLKGCDAEQSSVLREGDELLEINGIALMGKSTDEIIRLMSGEAGKILAFTLIPVHDDSEIDFEYAEKYVRAHFSYDGEIDEQVPCKELALSFSKGEILEISNQDDPDWWQARKVFDDGGESLPGLIPARQLQQKREVIKESFILSSSVEGRSRRRGLLSRLSRKKKRKIYYNQGPLSGVFQSVGHEVATYEDVIKLMPDYSRRRPIVLIGASLVGRRTLMKKLIESNPRHYCACVPHTSRPMRSGEMNGKEFHFISREEMEQYIANGKLLEYGETKGHLYGLSIKSVRKSIEDGKIPVLDLHPQALKVIGSSGLLPYIIFIASPRLDRLLMTRRVSSDKQKRKLTHSSSTEGLHKEIQQSFTEAELSQLYQASQEIQSEYGHYFDWVIVNDDLSVASDMLIEVARRIEEEVQWVPATWAEEV